MLQSEMATQLLIKGLMWDGGMLPCAIVDHPIAHSSTDSSV